MIRNMKSNLESDGLEFGSEEEFNRRLHEFCSYYRNRIQIFPSDCWTIIIFLFSCGCKKFYLKHFIAINILISSAILFTVSFIVLMDKERLILMVYGLSISACSIACLVFEKGAAVRINSSAHPEQRQSLVDFQEAVHIIADEVKDENEELKNSTEPKSGHIFERSAVPSHASDQFPPLHSYSSAGPSQVPDSFPAKKCYTSNLSDNRLTKVFDNPDAFLPSTSSAPASSTLFEDTTDPCTFTELKGDNSDIYEPPRCFFQARLATDAIKAFGVPAQIFGADSYIAFNSSDEYCPGSPLSSPEVFKTDEGRNSFETHVEVHHSDSHLPFSSSDDSLVFAEIASMAIDKSTRIARSDSCNNLLLLDDQSSESASNVLFEVKEEVSRDSR